MHLNRPLLPSFLASSSQRTWPSFPHVSRPNLRAQHSLTKNNKHIETIQRLQRPCSRDARLPFFSSGRRPPKLGRRPQCYIFFTFQQCTRWKYKQQTTEVFYCNFTDFGRLTPCFRTKTSAFQRAPEKRLPSMGCRCCRTDAIKLRGCCTNQEASHPLCNEISLFRSRYRLRIGGFSSCVTFSIAGMAGDTFKGISGQTKH